MTRKILLFIAISFVPYSTFAYDCWKEPHPTAIMRDADAVFTGKVISIKDIGLSKKELKTNRKEIEFQLQKIWKAPDEFKGNIKADVESLYRYNFEKDKTYLVYAYKLYGERLSLVGCPRVREIESADKAMLALGEPRIIDDAKKSEEGEYVDATSDSLTANDIMQSLGEELRELPKQEIDSENDLGLESTEEKSEKVDSDKEAQEKAPVVDLQKDLAQENNKKLVEPIIIDSSAKVEGETVEKPEIISPEAEPEVAKEVTKDLAKEDAATLDKQEETKNLPEPLNVNSVEVVVDPAKQDKIEENAADSDEGADEVADEDSGLLFIPGSSDVKSPSPGKTKPQ